MNFSGSVKKIYRQKRQSLIFVGDSIVWGAYLNSPSQNFTDLIQKYINDKYGYTGINWGWNDFIGNTRTICARNVTMDDVDIHPYLGYNPDAQFRYGPLLYDGSHETYFNGRATFDASFGVYPFSASTGISGRTFIERGTTESIQGWRTGAITLGVDGSKRSSIQFRANFSGNSGQGYLFLGMMGAGQFQVFADSSPIKYFNGTDYVFYPDYSRFYIGHKFTARATNGSTILDQITPLNGDWGAGNSLVGSYLYADGNALISPSGDYAARITGTTGNGTTTITMNYMSPVSGTYTFWALEGSTRKWILGPFQASGDIHFSIDVDEFVPVITMIAPTSPYPSTYTTVQTHGRNGYCLIDYASNPNYPFSGNVDVAAKQIMATVIHDEKAITEGYADRPTYVITVGINDIPGSGSPDYYKANLKRLASAFKNTNYENYGRVIFAIPMNTRVGRENFYLYRKAVIDAAKELGCDYIDLNRVKLEYSDYNMGWPGPNPNGDNGFNPFNDGVHPGATGNQKIAKYFINMLELNQII